MWFAFPIYFRSSEPLDGEVLLEEAIHLIEAESDEEAKQKAKALAASLQHRYVNVHGKEVCWSLYDIGEPWELLDDLRDGAEVYSRFISEKNREVRPQPSQTRVGDSGTNKSSRWKESSSKTPLG